LNELELKKGAVPADLEEEEEDLELDEISLSHYLKSIRTLVSNHKYCEALLQIDILLESCPNFPELYYHSAFCLQMMQIDPELALVHYGTALEKGFDEFWVKFQSGNLLHALGRFESAKVDLNLALLSAHDNHSTERENILSLLNSMSADEDNIQQS
jgi:tetratricopeptide (TPR) repeat protein